MATILGKIMITVLMQGEKQMEYYDLISRQAVIDAIEKNACNIQRIMDAVNNLPSIQSEQTKMIKEIRKWINSKNRGNADYFIVDKIEGIINKYE